MFTHRSHLHLPFSTANLPVIPSGPPYHYNNQHYNNQNHNNNHNHPRPPTGPRKPQTTTPRPTPAPTTAHIAHKKRTGAYFSITTPPAPLTPWSPLPNPSHANMETRPCHTSRSRIHVLTCGHTVAVPRDAEHCAANCAGMWGATGAWSMRGRHDSGPGSETLDAFCARRMGAAREGLRSYIATFLAVGGEGDVAGKRAAWELVRVFERMAFVHQRARGAEAGSVFACARCGEAGAWVVAEGVRVREAVPARFWREMFCVVVERDGGDRAVLEDW